MSTRVETYVGNNCRYASGALGDLYRQPGRESHLQQARRWYNDRRQPQRPDRRPAGRGLRDVVRECDPRSFAVVHHLERPGPNVRHQLPDARQQCVDGLRSDPLDFLHCRVGRGGNTTLDAAMTSTQTTISVASASGFPTTGTTKSGSTTKT